MTKPARSVYRRSIRIELVDEMAERGRVLNLARVLGLDSRLIADALVDVVERDPALQLVPQLTRSG